MPYAGDLKERMKRFLAKDAALKEAIEVGNALEIIRWVLVLSVFSAVLGVYWRDGSWHPIVYSSVAAYVVRVALGVVVYFAWTKPQLAKIEARFGADDDSP